MKQNKTLYKKTKNTKKRILRCQVPQLQGFLTNSSDAKLLNQMQCTAESLDFDFNQQIGTKNELNYHVNLGLKMPLYFINLYYHIRLFQMEGTKKRKPTQPSKVCLNVGVCET